MNCTHLQEYTESIRRLPEGRILDVLQWIYARSLIVSIPK